jgi:hypothetical protein
MSQHFKRTVEDFTCEHCGHKVKGNGYTNHCPKCLWSKHVDEKPGDREHSCQGLMEPVRLDVEKNEYIITHQCQICRTKKRNKTSPEDSFEELLKLTKKGEAELLQNL